MTLLKKCGRKISRGYDLKEYEGISRASKPRLLPLRCPLILECKRARGTRWLFMQTMKKNSMAFEYELSSDDGYTLNPIMNKIHKADYPKEYLVTIRNACPEVIYEYYDVFAEVYDKYEDFDMNGRIKVKRFETEGKHYSQCNEFATWLLSKHASSMPAVKQKKKFMKFIEKEVEDYLIRDLSILEEGLEYVDRQVVLATGRADIIAKDKFDNKVVIELKAQFMNIDAVQKLCGQVSFYFNELKSEDSKTRLFVVLKKEGAKHSYKLWNGLKHWSDKNKVKIFQFEKTIKKNYLFSELKYLGKSK